MPVQAVKALWAKCCFNTKDIAYISCRRMRWELTQLWIASCMGATIVVLSWIRQYIGVKQKHRFHLRHLHFTWEILQRLLCRRGLRSTAKQVLGVLKESSSCFVACVTQLHLLDLLLPLRHLLLVDSVTQTCESTSISTSVSLSCFPTKNTDRYYSRDQAFFEFRWQGFEQRPPCVQQLPHLHREIPCLSHLPRGYITQQAQGIETCWVNWSIFSRMRWMSCSISPDPISVAISSPPPVLPSPPSCAFRDDQYSHMHASIWKRANYHCLDALLDLGFDRFVICSRSMIAAMDIIAVTKDVRELSTELGID